MQDKERKEHKEHKKHKKHKKDSDHRASKRSKGDPTDAAAGLPSPPRRPVTASTSQRRDKQAGDRAPADASEAAERQGSGSAGEDLDSLRQQARRAKARSLSRELREHADMDLVLE